LFEGEPDANINVGVEIQGHGEKLANPLFGFHAFASDKDV
jgi:hypothetical protein